MPKQECPSLLLLVMALALSACTRPVLDTSAPERVPYVRVGLFVDTVVVELASAAGLAFIDPASGRHVSEVGPGELAVVRSEPAGSARTPGELSVGDDPTGLRHLNVRPRAEGEILIGGRPYRGTAIVRSTGPGRLTAINRLDLESYLLGVVPQEIGNVGEELLEAAKAQAVAARTYTIRHMGRRDTLGFDVFATVEDQVYGGVEAEHGPVSRAVRETAGEILTYEGEPVQAFYSSTCAGHTASIHEVWPPEPPRPYLTSVSDIDPGSGEAFCRSSNRFHWTERWSASEFAEILGETLSDSLTALSSPVATLRDLRVLERTPEGRIRSLAVITTVDTVVVGGDRIRWVFLRPGGGILNSAKFDVGVVRDAEGRPVEVQAVGGGWGHGIGMCQVGAMGRARAGQTYRGILDAYYRGTSIRRLY